MYLLSIGASNTLTGLLGTHAEEVSVLFSYWALNIQD